MTLKEKKIFESALIDRHGREVHEKLATATVAIAGLGGLGSNVAIHLARINVGTLILIDFDTVDVTNLNRQQYNIDQVGQFKTQALKQNLQKVNPFIEYQTHCEKVTPDNFENLFADADIIAECFDLADQKQMLVETALLKTPQKVIISASGMAGYGSSNSIITKKVNEHLYIVGDCQNAASAQKPLMAPRVAIAAAHQANAITELIITGQIETGK